MGGGCNKYLEATARFNNKFGELETRLDAKSGLNRGPSSVSSNSGSKRYRSAEPGDRESSREENSVVIVKGFPFPMWRHRLIEYGKQVCAPLVPSSHTVEYKASDNTKNGQNGVRLSHRGETVH